MLDQLVQYPHDYVQKIHENETSQEYYIETTIGCLMLSALAEKVTLSSNIGTMNYMYIPLCGMCGCGK